MTIPTLPPVPTRTAPSETEFAAAAETYLSALNPWAQEVDAVGVLVGSNALIASTAAATATAAANRAEAASGFRVSIAAASWTALAAITGSYAGQSAAVFGDAGTHTDPVVGGTVDNTGRYAWSVSPAGWQWIDDGSAGSVNWGDILDKPEEFEPAAHTHAISDITDLEASLTAKLSVTDAPELIRDTMGTALVAGDGVTITVNDGSDTITIAASGGGGSYPASGIAVSTGSAWAGSLAIPSGSLVGTSASQTLTNKTLSTGTSITAGNISGTTQTSGTIQAGVTISDAGTVAATSPGYRGAPVVTTTGRALTAADNGKIVSSTGALTYDKDDLPTGFTCLIFNARSSGDINCTCSDGTQYLRGSTINNAIVQVAAKELAALAKVSSTEFVISGAGVS